MMIANVQYIGPRIVRKLAHNTGSAYQRMRIKEALRRCPHRWWRTGDLALECGCSTHTAHQRCLELVRDGLADEQFADGRCLFRLREVCS